MLRRSDTVMIVTQTPLQAVVTNDQFLAAQLKRVKHPLLVKTCQKGGGKHTEREKQGPKVKP